MNRSGSGRCRAGAQRLAERPVQRLNLVEQILQADQAGLESFSSGEHHRTSISRPESDSRHRLRVLEISGQCPPHDVVSDGPERDNARNALNVELYRPDRDETRHRHHEQRGHDH